MLTTLSETELAAFIALGTILHREKHQPRVGVSRAQGTSKRTPPHTHCALGQAFRFPFLISYD